MLPELLYAKRDKEQSVDLTKLVNQDLAKDFHPWALDYVNGIVCSPLIDLKSLSSFSYIKTADIFLTKRFMMSTSLRAPPLS